MTRIMNRSHGPIGDNMLRHGSKTETASGRLKNDVVTFRFGAEDGVVAKQKFFLSDFRLGLGARVSRP